LDRRWSESVWRRNFFERAQDVIRHRRGHGPAFGNGHGRDNLSIPYTRILNVPGTILGRWRGAPAT